MKKLRKKGFKKRGEKKVAKKKSKKRGENRFEKREKIQKSSLRKTKFFVPGMSQYSDDLDVVQDAGTAKHTRSLSFSTSAANQMKVPQEFDIFSEASGSEESVNNHE